MATTRDHVAAYDYESRRRVTSLVLGADEAGRDPRRRLNRTLFGSLIIGVLVMVGFGVAGRLGGGRGPGLPDSGAVLVKGTGDRYVVVKGVVHPALNLASALLVGGGAPTQVRASALDGRPRGLPIGIPQAPDSLPQRLTRGAWTVCAVPSDSQVAAPTVEVLVGLPAPTQGVLDQRSAVVADAGGTSWLITLGRRFALAGNLRSTLNLQGARSISVPGQVLDTLPEGPEIAIPAVPRGGAPAYRLPVQAQLGDVIQTQVSGQPASYSLVQDDGLSTITHLTAVLLEAGGSRIVPAGAEILTSTPSARPAPGRAGWPKEVPTPVDPERGQPLCVSTTPGAPAGDAPWATVVSLPAQLPSPAGTVPVAGGTGDLPGVVTSVAITPGTVALVRATTSSGGDGGYDLVTEAGQRYPVVSADAVARLQYRPEEASPVPLPFVALLPSGPTLDPDAAAKEYAGTAPSPS